MERTSEGRIVVVAGYSDAEHDRAIADLISKGEAQERDLFVCLMRFGEMGRGSPFPPKD